jgi:hypothetical protein
MESDPCNPCVPAGLFKTSLRGSSYLPTEVFRLNLFISFSGEFPCRYPCLGTSDALPIVIKGVIATALAIPVASQTQYALSSESKKADEVHQGSDAVASCRLCLIACNSRQFDEAGVRA